MDKEKTLVIIKPDAVSRNLIGAIISLIEKNNIKIRQMKMMTLSQKQAEDFYSIHKDQAFYDNLIAYMTSGPIVIMVLEGLDVIKQYRKLMGKTNPEEADEGTIRKQFAVSLEKNSVHGSDSLENAKIEIDQFFTEEEIFS